MQDLLFGFSLEFLALILIGIGPCLLLVTAKDRLVVAFHAAPAAGLVITTLCGYYCTVMNIPVSRWAFPWVIVSIGFSSVVSWAIAKNGMEWKGDRVAVAWGSAGLLLVSVLSLAPQFTGGTQFSVLRGNGTDTFNYIATAGYLDHEPITWADKTDRQTVVDRHPVYERARQLVLSRWATPMFLAFSSRIAGVPLWRFDYVFSVLLFAVSYGPLFLLALSLGYGPVRAALVAVAVSVGFWAQFVIDVRALGHQHSLPVLLLLAFLLVRIHEAPAASWRLCVAAGAAAAALVAIYPEIVPMTALGVALFIVLAAWHRRLPRVLWVQYGLCAGIAAIGAFPVYPVLSHFLKSQLAYAAGGVNNWHLAYFTWLQANPLTGVWGLPPLSGVLHQVPSTALGLVLTAVSAYAVYQVVVRRSTGPGAALQIAVAMTLAAGVQSLYLLWRGQIWAAGKGLSYGFAFLLLLLAGSALVLPVRVARWRLWLANGAKLAIAAWVVTQLGLAIVRPVYAAKRMEYAQFIIHHGEYRQHDTRIEQFVKAATADRGVTVWVNVASPWLADYLDFALGWDVRVVNLGPSRDVLELGALKPTLAGPPQYVIADNAAAVFPESKFAPVLARNSEISMVKVNSGAAALIGLKNPNGVEGSPQHPFFWMGGTAPTLLRILSPTAGLVVVHGSFTMGPSARDQRQRTLSVRFGENAPEHVVIRPGPQQFSVPVQAGVGVVSAVVEDRPEPARLLPTDPRPLLLRVDDLSIESGGCAATNGQAEALAASGSRR